MWCFGIYKILMVCTTGLLNGWPPLFTGNQMYRRGEGGRGRLLHLNTTLTEFLPCSGRQEGARYEIGVNESGGSCLYTSWALSLA